MSTFDKQRDAVIRSAIDFMDTAIGELGDKPKYSALHFAIALELFLKARLMEEHWSLVLQKPGVKSRENFFKGKSKTVGASDAFTRIQGILGPSGGDKAKVAFDKIASHRNQIVHFHVQELAEADSKASQTADLAAAQCSAWYHLRRLLTRQWKDCFDGHLTAIEGLNEKMVRNRDFLDLRRKQVKGLLRRKQQEGTPVRLCRACDSEAAAQRGDGRTHKAYDCLVCGTMTSYVRMKCSACGHPEPIEAYSAFEDVCPHCGAELDLEAVKKQVGVKAKDRAGAFDAWCWECGEELWEATVVRIAERPEVLLCLGCGEQYEHVQGCDCGEWTVARDKSQLEEQGCASCYVDFIRYAVPEG